MELPNSILTKNQKLTFRKRITASKVMIVHVRYDDECNNGHNTFAITADTFGPHRQPGETTVTENGKTLWMESCGCQHEEIAKHFPELAPLIKWHLVSSDGPTHYLANATYHASNRDHNGLLKGEQRQIRNGKTGKLAWKRQDVTLPQYVDSDEMPTDTQLIGYEPWCITGEGKERDFKAARSVAVWPEATDEQLSLPKDELAALLAARLPALMAEFKAAIESIGFVY